MLRFAAAALVGLEFLAAGVSRLLVDEPTHPGLVALAERMGAGPVFADVVWLLQPHAELALGILFLTGCRHRALLLTTAVVLATFSLWVVFLALHPSLAVHGCGCFARFTAEDAHAAALVWPAIRLSLMGGALLALWLSLRRNGETRSTPTSSTHASTAGGLRG